MTKKLFVFVVLVLGGIHAFTQIAQASPDPIPFTAPVNYWTGDPVSVFCADLDGDGDLDIAVANFDRNHVSVLKNNGDGTFQDPVNYATAGNPSSVFCKDLDGDGDQDLAVANAGSKNISILKNNGNGIFQLDGNYAIAGNLGDHPQNIFCADLDNDGDPDLAVSNRTTDYVSILKNNGDGTFQTKVDYAVGGRPYSVFCGDLDGDSDFDLAVANGYDDNVSILKNNGDGTFQPWVHCPVGIAPQAVYGADLDGDGDVDLAVANWTTDNVSILKNNGNATFQPAVHYGAGDAPQAVFCADLDGDLHPEVVVANRYSGNVSILKNNGDGTFQAVDNYLTGPEAHSVFCADLNGDGYLDLAVGNAGTNEVSILINLTMPAPPDEWETLEFSGRTWHVKKAETPVGPGKNYFTARKSDIWVDEAQDELHLRILYRHGRWYCSEVYSDESFGYGEYVFVFYLATEAIEDPPPNAVLGLFTWDTTTCVSDANSEIDIEVSKWGDNSADSILLYAVQPTGDAIYTERFRKFPMDLNDDYSTHVFQWTPYRVQFWSYHGQDYPTNDLIPEWDFFDPETCRSKSDEECTSECIDIPKPGPATNVRMNLWLCDCDGDKIGDPLSNDTSEVFEVIIKAFEFVEAPILKFVKGSPVDVRITTPDSNIIDREVNEIPGGRYEVYELTPGDSGATVTIPYPPAGVYYVEVIPWPTADPTATYSVIAVFENDTTILAQDVPLAAAPDYPYRFWTIPIGSISGSVSDSLDGLLGVTIDLFDSNGTLAQFAITDTSGFFEFDSVDVGDYNISIVTPLGYVADFESRPITVTMNADSVVNFTLHALEIVPSQRSMGYWKHQVNVHLSGKGGAQEGLAEMSNYMGLIGEHFNNNLANPITIFEVPQPASQTDSLEVLQDLLTVRGNAGMNAKARQHLIAVLLNVVSLKLHQTTPISEDNASVSQAITYCHQLIADSDPANDETAKDIADQINNGLLVASGVIPLTTPNIAYKGTGDQEAQTPSAPKEFSLSQNYPNPFNPICEIAYVLPTDCQVTLSIYNILGQKVRVLLDEYQSAGDKSVKWDGKDDQGQEVTSGVYFYRIQAGDFVQSRKMVLMK